jgi:hypothetical protein
VEETILRAVVDGEYQCENKVPEVMEGRAIIVMHWWFHDTISALDNV